MRFVLELSYSFCFRENLKFVIFFPFVRCSNSLGSLIQINYKRKKLLFSSDLEKREGNISPLHKKLKQLNFSLQYIAFKLDRWNGYGCQILWKTSWRNLIIYHRFCYSMFFETLHFRKVTVTFSRVKNFLFLWRHFQSIFLLRSQCSYVEVNVLIFNFFLYVGHSTKA